MSTEIQTPISTLIQALRKQARKAEMRFEEVEEIDDATDQNHVIEALLGDAS
jgi:hypothetical protein